MNCSLIFVCGLLVALAVLSDSLSLRHPGAEESKVRAKRQSTDDGLDYPTTGGGGCGGKNGATNGRMRGNNQLKNGANNRGGGGGGRRGPPPRNGTMFGDNTGPSGRFSGPPPPRNFSSNGYGGPRRSAFNANNQANLMHPKPVEVSGSLEISGSQGALKKPITRSFASSSASSVSSAAGTKMVTAMQASST